jgi:cell division septum initiation protein DivIVA
MSGTWRDRVESGRFLKPGDVAAALRDIAGTLEGIGKQVEARSDEAQREIDALKATVDELTERVVGLEAATRLVLAPSSADPAVAAARQSATANRKTPSAKATGG